MTCDMSFSPAEPVHSSTQFTPYKSNFDPHTCDSECSSCYLCNSPSSERNLLMTGPFPARFKSICTRALQQSSLGPLANLVKLENNTTPSLSREERIESETWRDRKEVQYEH